MRRARNTFFFLPAFCFFIGCAGVWFGPGYSMRDKSYFIESPHIVVRGGTYSLRWRYGTMGFFFEPRSRVVGEQLWFSLQGTASSGSLSGQYGEIQITEPRKIQALESGGAYWWEPDGRRIRLEIRRVEG